MTLHHAVEQNNIWRGVIMTGQSGDNGLLLKLKAVQGITIPKYILWGILCTIWA